MRKTVPVSSRREFLATLGASALGLAIDSLSFGAARPKPNVVLFVVDDMGWMDTTVYGSRYYETPQMERLSRDAMIFTDAYTASPLCSPTRCSIMTGKYPARTRLTTACGHRKPLPEGSPSHEEKAPPYRKMLLPMSRRFMKPEEFTLAEALKRAGYRTGHFGKWHLGLEPQHWPEAQGFETSFHGAPDPGPRSYFSPYQFEAGTVTDGPLGEYITDRLTDEAISFMKAHKDEPFYLNLWHYGVHGPWGHKEEITRSFRDKSDPRGKQGNPIMASMLKSVDQSLGRILDALEELGLRKSTLFLFFSDNGGNVHSNTEEDRKPAPLGSRRWELLQDWRQWAGVQPPTNNHPLRAGKGCIYEGGIRVPFMASWPGVIPAETKCHEIVSSVDLYPTIMDLLSVSPQEEQIWDGESLKPLLQQTGKLEREAIFIYFPHGLKKPPGVSVRKGPWKLIRWFETNRDFPEEFELYHLENDLGETTNLAAAKSGMVSELNALIEEHFARTGAFLPVANPDFDPSSMPVNDWFPQKGTSLEHRDNFLRVRSESTRPFIHTSRVPNAKGDLVVRLKMRSQKGNGGRLYWSSMGAKGFAPERRVDLDPNYDGQWHEYEARFQVKSPLRGLRIDPSLSPCQADIAWVRLEDDQGTLLQDWDFEDAQ